VSVGLSVSRVGSAAQIKATKQVAGKVKLELAAYRELAAFAQFGSDLDARTRRQLDRGSRTVELFKQPAYSPKPMEIQVALLWSLQNDYFDDIEVGDIVDASASLQEYLETGKEAILKKILDKKKLDEEIEGDLKEAVSAWKSTFKKG
jgi:F-type H+-transporting ATPase subunit alpha